MQNQNQPQPRNNTTSQASASMLSDRRAAKDPAFGEKLRQMALPLAPLVQLTTGDVHPAFPPTLLNFWLLTDAQLEELAHFYHQRTPCRWTFHYPCPITWTPDMPLEEKRRKIGRFIGLRGCESPIRVKSEEDIMEEARRARLGDEEEMWRRKMRWC
ncbi:Uu.00g046480.m01.CDS01 [Anthostomella pinea]|uniref:Uu.00g046480.m01.CDS01 n=1 Tax=Anthostomella pinea TaxID=933095 RepID=A0AAI8YEH6_9PEZI|nr:Uu.00g046480.m01.CDS01 [Anthostomella pinea]